MNLIPVNRLFCRNLGGDVATLPNWSGMHPFLLGPSEVMLMSSEDIRCFFYLFAVPVAWQRYLWLQQVGASQCGAQIVWRASVCSGEQGATYGLCE